jgi:hypothetical protein
MARPKNLLQSHKLRLTITDGLWRELEDLVQTERFGRSVYDAIDRLLPDAVDAAFARARASLDNKQAVTELLARGRKRSRGKR